MCSLLQCEHTNTYHSLPVGCFCSHDMPDGFTKRPNRPKVVRRLLVEKEVERENLDTQNGVMKSYKTL